MNTLLLWALTVSMAQEPQEPPCQIPASALGTATTLVAEQATVELSLFKREAPDPVEASEVSIVMADSSGSCAFTRADVPSIFGWKSYSFASNGTALIPAGGFEYHYLTVAARSFMPLRPTEISTALVAAAEARFGAPMTELSTRHEIPDSLMKAWRTAQPPEWPAAGEVRLPNGQYLVRLTALRPRVPSAGHKFVPVVYGFLFSRTGELVAASLREGGPV